MEAHIGIDEWSPSGWLFSAVKGKKFHNETQGCMANISTLPVGPSLKTWTQKT